MLMMAVSYLFMAFNLHDGAISMSTMSPKVGAWDKIGWEPVPTQPTLFGNRRLSTPLKHLTTLNIGLFIPDFICQHFA